MKIVSTVSLVVFVLAVAATFVLTAQESRLNRKSTDGKSAALMFAKLSASNRIVEGMMAADYQRIQAAASQMANICSTQNWPNQNNEITDQWRSELRRASLKMARLAGEGNLEGVAHTYNQLLGTCLDCHSYSRDVLRVAHQSRDQFRNSQADGIGRESGVVSIPVYEGNAGSSLPNIRR